MKLSFPFSSHPNCEAPPAYADRANPVWAFRDLICKLINLADHSVLYLISHQTITDIALIGAVSVIVWLLIR